MYFGGVESFAASFHHGDRLFYLAKAFARLAGFTQRGGNNGEILSDSNACPIGPELGKVAPHPRDPGMKVVSHHLRPAEVDMGQRTVKGIARLGCQLQGGLSAISQTNKVAK